MAVLAAGAVGSVIAWQLWDNIKDSDEPFSTTLRNIALIIGGLIAVLLAMWRSRVAERQAETAQQGLLYDRYQRGSEMLGSRILSVRLGGIYALQSLSEEFPEPYHIQVMRQFCAFVRHPPELESYSTKAVSGSEELEEDPVPREDVQEVLKIILFRNKIAMEIEREAGFIFDFRGADLRHAHIGGAKLQRSNLERANLSHAQLTGVDLSAAWMRKANLSNAEIIGANLTGAILQEATLTEAILDRANLSDARLQMANLSRASLIQAIATETNFIMANLSLSKLMGADLNGAVFHAANVSGAFFSNPSHADDFGKFLITTETPLRGLTEEQLAMARARRNNPPKLDGVLDENSRNQIAFKGRVIEDGDE